MTLASFETDAQAIAFAWRMFAADGKPRYVIESRNEERPDRPFVVDTDGFTRNWERTVAVIPGEPNDTPRSRRRAGR